MVVFAVGSPAHAGIDPNLKALKRCALGLDLYLWLAYRTFALDCPVRLTWRQGLPPVRSRPHQGERSPHRSRLPPQGAPRTKEDQDRLAGANYATAKDVLILSPSPSVLPPPPQQLSLVE